MELLGFLAVATVVIVTPGPDTALLIRNALAGGRRAGYLTALGVSTGQATWALAASVGLAALLAASEPAFHALRLAGAAYLLYLGAASLRAAWRGERSHPRAAPPAGVPFRQGLLSNLGNPKMAVFFTSLLPQFGGTSFTRLLALGLLFALMTSAWLAAYGVAVAKAGDLLRRTPVRRVLDAVTGAVLVALGLRVATERR